MLSNTDKYFPRVCTEIPLAELSQQAAAALHLLALHGPCTFDLLSDLCDLCKCEPWEITSSEYVEFIDKGKICVRENKRAEILLKY